MPLSMPVWRSGTSFSSVKMTIDVEGGLNVCMAHKCLDLLQIGFLLNKDRGEEVPQVA
jgi:hypothetical protein